MEDSVEPPQLFATTMETVQLEDESVPEIIEENASPAMQASTGENVAEEKTETREELSVADTKTEIDSATKAEAKEEEREELDTVDFAEEPGLALEEKLDAPRGCPEPEVDASKAENVVEVPIVEPFVDPFADEPFEGRTKQMKVEDSIVEPLVDPLADGVVQESTQQVIVEVAIGKPLVDPVADGVVHESTQQVKVEDAIVEPLVDPVSDRFVQESTQQVKVEEKPVTQPPQSLGLSDSVGTIPLILTLPIDSLHCIASFLAPGEWASFGRSGKGSSRVCREIFRRVRMHGFRCATELVTAWVSQSSNNISHQECEGVELIYSFFVDLETRSARRCKRNMCPVYWCWSSNLSSLSRPFISHTCLENGCGRQGNAKNINWRRNRWQRCRRCAWK